MALTIYDLTRFNWINRIEISLSESYLEVEDQAPYPDIQN